MAGIYDKVPCKSLHRTKFNLSNRLAMTGDIGPVYPTMCQEVIPGDVWDIGHEQATKFNPMISPLMTEVNLDSHQMFVPMRLMYERWHDFISGGKNGNYNTPLKSLQDLFKIYYGDDTTTMGDKSSSVWHDLYLYIKQLGIKNCVRFYYGHGLTGKSDATTANYVDLDANTNPTRLRFINSLFSSYESFYDNIVTYFQDTGINRLAYYMAFSCGNLLDISGYPCNEEAMFEKFCLAIIYDQDNGDIVYTGIIEKGSSTDISSNVNLNNNTLMVVNGNSIEVDNFIAIFESQYWLPTPIFAYWYCYDEWFRHPEFDDPYYCKWLRDGTLGASDDEFDEGTDTAWIGFVHFNRTWRKDYFTALLPTAQRGTAPALPISGIIPVELVAPSGTGFSASEIGVMSASGSSAQNVVNMSNTGVTPNRIAALDLSNATTFDINDLRLANAIQRFQELNNIAGTRYTGFLRVQYGTAPADEILQRPDYFGRSREPIKFGDVLSQDSGGSSPLGTRAGLGSSYGVNFSREYHPKEHGVIIEFVSVIPKPQYAGQGIDRSLKRKNKEDYYNSLFAGLGEQEVLTDELFFDTAYLYSKNDHLEDRVLGFIGRYDEYRSNVSHNRGLMRNSKYNSYSLDRFFTSAPSLNSEFVHCYVDKYQFMAVPSEPTFILYWGHLINVYRPMPEFATPSLSN